MRNRCGKTISERINEEIEYLQHVENNEQRIALAYKVIGSIDIAVEFGLIPFEEWEIHIHRIFKYI